MAIQPSNINADFSKQPQKNDIIALIRSLPLKQPLPAKILREGLTTQLVINFANQIRLKLPATVSLPLPSALETSAEVLTTVLQKLPDIILKIEFASIIPENKTTKGSDRLVKNKILNNFASPQNQRKTPNSVNIGANAQLILALVKSSSNEVLLKILTLENNNTTLLKSSIDPDNILGKQNKSTTLNEYQSPAKNSLGIQQSPSQVQKGINGTSADYTNAQKDWPQHSLIENASLSSIVKALSQLSRQISLEKLPAEFQVIQRWIQRLVSSIKNTANETVSLPLREHLKANQIQQILSNSGSRFEASLRENVRAVANNNTTVSRDLDNDIKSQIIKILQAIPVVLQRYATTLSPQQNITETEIWQVIFKVQKILDTAQTHLTRQLTPTEQPQIWTNWIEQTFKLLTVWLKNVETRQSDQMNPQMHQQTALRFDMPIPLQQGVQWINVEMEQFKKNSKKSKKWLWQLTLNFNFGEGKYLGATTKINAKLLTVEFEGSIYFQSKMHHANLRHLEAKLNEKTHLETTVTFKLNETGKPLDSSDGIHLEV